MTTQEKIEALDWYDHLKELKDILDDLVPVTIQSVAKLGTTTNLPAVSASFADLAAARTAVEAQRVAVEARLDSIEAKIDEIITKLGISA